MPTSAALELTFVGHQTWHISDGDAVDYALYTGLLGLHA